MKKSKDRYLSKGCDQKTAEYFASGRKKIVSIAPREDLTLLFEFDNGEHRRYDCKSVIKEHNSWFGSLVDYAKFKRVYLGERGAPSWDLSKIIFEDRESVPIETVDLDSDRCYIDSVPEE